MKWVVIVLVFISFVGCGEPIPDARPTYHRGEIIGSTVDPDLRGVVVVLRCHYYHPCLYDVKWRSVGGEEAFDYDSYVHEYEMRKLPTQRY